MHVSPLTSASRFSLEHFWLSRRAGAPVFAPWPQTQAKRRLTELAPRTRTCRLGDYHVMDAHGKSSGAQSGGESKLVVNSVEWTPYSSPVGNNHAGDAARPLNRQPARAVGIAQGRRPPSGARWARMYSAMFPMRRETDSRGARELFSRRLFLEFFLFDFSGDAPAPGHIAPF